MKYNHDSMLPIGAFKPRGSVVGGRSMRLHGGDSWYYEPEPTGGSWGGGGDAGAVWIPDPEPAPAPWSPPPEAPAPAPAPAPWSPPPEPAPAPALPVAPAAPDWTQTVNDIYQQTFGRQADPSGMATFTNLLNQGMTGEQMREALRTSPEGQSMGLSPAPAPAAPVAPLAPAAPTYTPFNLDQYGYTTDTETQYYNAAKLANWQMEQGRPDLAQPYIEEANALKQKLDSPFRIDTITGGGGGDAGSGSTETYLVDKSGSIISAVAPQDGGKYSVNFEGAGDSGTSSSSPVFTLDDLLKQAVSEKNTPFGLGRGQAVGYAYELKNEDGEPYQRYDANGNLTEFVNRLTGEWTKASDVKPIGSVFDPNQGKFVTEYKYGDNKFISTLGSGGSTFAPIMDPYSKDTGGFMGEGGWAKAGALVAAGLTAGLASGALVPASVAAAAPGSTAAIGLTAAKGALTSIAVAGIQGATPDQMLKAGILGGVGAGLGGFVGAADLGTVGNIAAKAGIQTGLAAIAGGNVPNALISSLINSTLPVVLNEALPPETSNIISSLPKPIQNIIMSTAGSVIGAGFNGQDISNAAVSGVTNGLVSLGKDIASGAFKDLSESELAQTVKDYLTPKTTAGGFLGEYGDMAPPPSQTDVIDSIFQQDAEDVINRNPPPLVQDAINRNTPVTAETVITPPLVQNAINQAVNPDDVTNALLAGLENPYIGTPSAPLASATTSDVNPVAVENTPTLPEVSVTGDEDTLRIYNEEMEKLGLPTAESVDDPAFVGALDRINAGTYNPDAPLESPFQPQLPASEYEPAIKALEDAGLDVSYRTLDQFTQEPGALVDAVYPALAGRQPTEQERINFIDQYSNSATASPQDLIKEIYDQVQLDKQVPVYIDQSTSPTPVTPPLETAKEPVEEPVKEPTASSSTSGDNQPAGGLGTQGASSAGNEGAPGALTASGEASESESQADRIASEAASAGDIPAEDIAIDTQRILSNSSALGVSPEQAISSGLINPDGSLTDKGIKRLADISGLLASDVVALTNASTTARTDTGSGVTSTGAGATTGADSGAAISGTGVGGLTGTNVGGLGTGTGVGVGEGTGTGSGDGFGSGLGLGGAGTGTSGSGTGGAKAPVVPTVSSPSYSYFNLGAQGASPGALPGNLEATFLQGANVNDYNPFENYNVYEQLQPVRAAQGGSPLQLAQMQQSVYGIDPSLYSVLQKRQAPNYFTYGSDTSGGEPTKFAGSQLQAKPTPGIPVIPTGQASSSDWLYKGSGSNPLASAGSGISNLPAGMLAQGGQAHGGGEGEHIPEFITGATGHYVKGRGDGQSDDIPAMLADGEFVFDSSSVSTLGNGSSDAGAKLLDAFRESLREHTRAAPKDKIPPKASPLMYMQEAMKKVGMK